MSNEKMAISLYVIHLLLIINAKQNASLKAKKEISESFGGNPIIRNEY